MDVQGLKQHPVAKALYRLPWLLSAYHFLLACLGALAYGFPSRGMVVVGVTGTKGKTTTCDLIAQILAAAGFRVGMATTVRFRVHDREWVNATKQTMPGRFGLQKLLKEMRDSGCTHAVIETSSEGILQYRHRFINYRVGVFTNLSPEHIERHGSLESYRGAKVKLFEEVALRNDGVGIYNLDDPNVPYFLEPDVRSRYGYGTKQSVARCEKGVEKGIALANIKLSKMKSTFTLGKARYETPLIGMFNVYNAAAAATTALALGVQEGVVRRAIRAARPTPGRLDRVDIGQPFLVIVDYAHEPASLRAAYEAVNLFRPRRIIGILGSQGGGRDRWKRAAMGRVVAEYCDHIILTNEDPYDEDPYAIVADIEKGIRAAPGKHSPKIETIIDRREAIARALAVARPEDAVVLTGKGGEVWMCVGGGKKMPWDEKKIVEELLRTERPAKRSTGLTKRFKEKARGRRDSEV